MRGNSTEQVSPRTEAVRRALRQVSDEAVEWIVGEDLARPLPGGSEPLGDCVRASAEQPAHTAGRGAARHTRTLARRVRTVARPG